jgi:hypothetical protein
MFDTGSAMGHRFAMPPSAPTPSKLCLIRDCPEPLYANGLCKFHDELTDHGKNMAALRPRRHRVRDGKQVGTRISLENIEILELAIKHGLIEGPRLYTGVSVIVEEKAQELRKELEHRGALKSGSPGKTRRKK